MIINNIQEIFNHLPNFDTEEIIKSLSIQTNNNYLMLYMASLVRTTVSLHKLINNRIMVKEDEKKGEKPVKEEVKEKKPQEGKVEEEKNPSK